jgi:acyl-coenzyme A synthetase/AMP-(fatty) acid ligase
VITADSILERIGRSRSALFFGNLECDLPSILIESERKRRLWSGFIKPGDICAFAEAAGADFLSTLLAIWTLKAAALPLDPGLHPRRRQDRVERADASLQLRPEGWLRRPNAKHASGLVLFTSGSSGHPRAVCLTLPALEGSIDMFIERFRLTGQDTFVSGISPYHGLGLLKFLLTPILLGATTVLVDTQGNRIKNWLEGLREHRATVTGGTNHTLDAASRLFRGEPLMDLRFVLVGGEPIRLNSLRSFERAIGRQGVVRPCYGLTECPSVSGLGFDQDIRTDSQGHACSGTPFEGLQVQVRDDQGAVLGPGQRGMVWVSGSPVFSSYLDSLEETGLRLRGGWLLTGDWGMLDEQNHLFIYGRQQAMIKRAGTTLAPREIEQIVEELEEVERCLAVGIPSQYGTHDLILLIVGDSLEKSLVARISALVLERIGFSPRRVQSISSEMLPKTDSGKVDEARLRELVLEMVDQQEGISNA